ncbi:MAG TPA: Vms1/Ankzf1 family peptidyl-tRNA hydrolase [Solirubrobacteraceae bacterium]|nr:Vms1/Ankzf1 family peptidyl-tRNA hydrolase [Solirubrobacteraceae bacterium]
MSTTEAAGQARRLIEYKPGHPVISLYMDLDPERFATPPARDSQIRSLVDQARRTLEAQDGLGHDERVGLKADIQHIDEFLTSTQAPFKGARALAVFCSGQVGLFEVLQLSRPTEARVVIAPTPFVEPLVAALEAQRWLIALVSRRDGRVIEGPADGLREEARLDEFVRGQHDQGGWSQPNYERSIEKDTDDHLRRVADAVNQRWRAARFHRLAVGGPAEIVPRFEALLAGDVRPHVIPERVAVDLSSATEEEIRRAVAKLVAEDEKRSERDALNRLEAGIGSGGRGAGGLFDTISALNERRVQTLLLEPAMNRRGARCPTCGLLMIDPDDRCPADGSELDEVEHLREGAIEAALAQGADVLVVRHYPDLGPLQGIGALLRF